LTVGPEAGFHWAPVVYLCIARGLDGQLAFRLGGTLGIAVLVEAVGGY
jgi:hypothetical protein